MGEGNGGRREVGKESVGGRRREVGKESFGGRRREVGKESFGGRSSVGRASAVFAEGSRFNSRLVLL